jgi:hypothetical protein
MEFFLTNAPQTTYDHADSNYGLTSSGYRVLVRRNAYVLNGRQVMYCTNYLLTKVTLTYNLEIG